MNAIDSIVEMIRGPTPALPGQAGIVLGVTKKRKKEEIYYIKDDVHALCIGATRSGKSRCVVLPSIGLMGLAGESILSSDPKGGATRSQLKMLGVKPEECGTKGAA